MIGHGSDKKANHALIIMETKKPCSWKLEGELRWSQEPFDPSSHRSGQCDQEGFVSEGTDSCLCMCNNDNVIILYLHAFVISLYCTFLSGLWPRKMNSKVKSNLFPLEHLSCLRLKHREENINTIIHIQVWIVEKTDKINDQIVFRQDLLKQSQLFHTHKDV